MRMMGWVGVLAVAAVVVTGCGGTPGEQDAAGGGVVVLAKAEGWRDGLRDAAGHAYALVEIASDERTAQRAWEDNVPQSLPDADGDPAEPGRYARLESVDLDRQAVVVYSSGQSGTCPSWVTGIETTDDRIEVALASTADQGEACTDDFQAYRLVVAVDRDRLPDPAQLPIERIDVSTENLTDVEGRAVAYPAEDADPAGAGDEQAGSAAASGDGIGPPAGLEIAGTDRIEIRDVPTDPGRPGHWPTAKPPTSRRASSWASSPIPT
ncbi:hypothetical protein ER308_04260 [Egibacter rhizosphaerae]|uniref:Uncharacterized protein n=1 Tax=Egibacter rhizosphaerae TaxID=1670831 RepID=A0A411YCE2_9ACTN|nr:hypothetical protein [Egibacter rhizosphaerae]QBI18832.1 hypothetical protein ER308_04260 [Egibacter rhizosphaerae]